MNLDLGPAFTRAQTVVNGLVAAIPRARSTGYLQALDADGLMRIARDRDLVVRVHARLGGFVRKGGVLLTMAPAPSEGERDDNRFHDMFIIGSDRTGTQDVTFFIDQLVELAVRALSPGINDPGTRRASASIGSSRRCVISAAAKPRRPSDTTTTDAFVCLPVP